MGKLEQKLSRMGHSLPAPFDYPSPNRTGCVLAGGLLFVSGHPPPADMGVPLHGQVGGAVSEEDQRNRLGHYYTIKWDGPEGRENEAVRLVFQYRQAASGSEVRQMEVKAPAGRKGHREIQVIGPSYLEGGRVLAWHLSFYRGTDLIETRQSYLWD